MAPEETKQEDLTQVKIKIRAFPYYVDEEDPITGENVKKERIATNGEVVELSPLDLRRAKRFEAIVVNDEGDPVVDETDTTPPGLQGQEFLLSTADVPEIAEWLKTEKPTVDQVVEEVNEDPNVAQRVIEAENLATGGQPRSTLIEQMEEIVE